MQYLLMCCFDEDRWAKISESQRDKVMQDYHRWIQEHIDSGQHRAGAKLGSSATAITIREKDGKPVITDGPFAETKEQLGGYHLIECKDFDEAVSIARQIPTLPLGGAIEVRAVETSD